MDEDELEVSAECKADLDKLRKTPTKEQLQNFYGKYGKSVITAWNVFQRDPSEISYVAHTRKGRLFEPQIHLGGRLFSTEQFDGVAGSTVSQKITNLKIAASASLSGFGFQANVDFKYGKHKNEKEETNTSSMTQSISWCAEGGDTTLCNKYVIP